MFTLAILILIFRSIVVGMRACLFLRGSTSLETWGFSSPAGEIHRGIGVGVYFFVLMTFSFYTEGVFGERGVWGG